MAVRRLGYSTDLSDTEWEVLAPLVPPPKSGGRPPKTGVKPVEAEAAQEVEGGAAAPPPVDVVVRVVDWPGGHSVGSGCLSTPPPASFGKEEAACPRCRQAGGPATDDQGPVTLLAAA